MCVCYILFVFFFFKQKTAYEMRISDWSSDVCSSDLVDPACSALPVNFHGEPSECFQDNRILVCTVECNQGVMYPVAEGGVTCHATGGIKPQHRRIGLHGAQACRRAKDLAEGGWLLLHALAISRESRI